MRSIKWCYFQWPWTNPNPVFKVTPLFDAKYLTNGYRYGHNYYRRRIGNRRKAFEWHQFQWPRVTSNPNFKVTILFNVKCQITRKRYKIELYLQWPTNRKSHVVYRTAPFSMTLNLVFKVTPFFDPEYLRNGYRYSHSYYRRRIWNCTQAFEWHQLQRYWVTSNPDIKVTILFNVIELENGTR